MSRREGDKVFRGLVAVSSATAVAIMITALISMVMPLALTLKGYAYWQLFSLYSSFVGFFALGFNDGVYQKYSHSDFTAETAEALASLKWIVVMLGAAGAVMTAACSVFFPTDKKFSVVATACCITFFGLNGFLTYTNQLATKLYVVASSTLVERASLLLATLLLFAANVHDYRWFVTASVVASMMRLIYLTVMTPSVMRSRGVGLKALRDQIPGYFKTGMPLMIAILMGSSILVPSRLVVESTQGPEAFALYSFALTVVFITGAVLSSLAQSVFPLLSRMDSTRLNISIRRAHAGLTILAAPLLGLYFIAALAIEFLYPSFTASLEYMGLLFPLFIFQSKYLILLCTLYRAEDKVFHMVLVGGTGMALNLACALGVSTVTHSMLVLASTTLVAYIFWLTIWWLKEVQLRGIGWQRSDSLELVLTVGFLGSLAAPRFLGTWGHTGLGISGGIFLCFLMIFATREHTWIQDQIGGDLSRLWRRAR